MFVLVDVGAIGGNNLITLVAVVGGAALAVDWIVGRWNLRGLGVQWQLPAELFAGQGARGAFIVRNGRQLGTARGLEVDDGHAITTVDAVPAGAECASRVWWRFPDRGPFAIAGAEVRSLHPFGFFVHRVRVEGRADGLVYPRPLAGEARSAGETIGDTTPDDRQADTGDFRDLRPYRPGDRLRSIHWRTSARAGEPMVVVRGGERSEGVWVQVQREPLEDELSRATGAVLEACHHGVPVGLVLPDDDSMRQPRAGTRWRRELLDALARFGLDSEGTV